MKNNVLFCLADMQTEELFQNSYANWSPLLGLCQNTQLPFSKILFMYWPRDEEKLAQFIAHVHSIHPNISFTTQKLPFPSVADIQSSKENEEIMARVVYGYVLDYAYNYEKETYFYYLEGIHSFFRALIFYFATRSMVHMSILDIEPPSNSIPWPGRILSTQVDMRVYASLAKIIRDSKYDAYSFLKSGIQTENAQFNAIIEQIEFVAVHSRDQMLILGPTGAGKSALVKRIYQLKNMKKNLSGPFVEVNCAAIRGNFAQSQLFGHVRGAFTGAETPRDGLLKTAHNGLLFLDEIGVLGMEEQALLLKAIEDKQFFPLGADKEVGSDFQLICGTNLDLAAEVERGSFRADLFSRINLWTFTLPGLADRPEDIEPNLDFELMRHQEKTGNHVMFSPKARTRFLNFATSPETPWSNNFRDFTSSIRRMLLFATTGVVNEQHVEDEIARLKKLWKVTPLPPSPYPLCQKTLAPATFTNTDPFDLVQLEAVLRVCQHAPTLSDAGRTLFAASRTQRTSTNDSDRLRKFLARSQLDWQKIKEIL